MVRILGVLGIFTKSWDNFTKSSIFCIFYEIFRIVGVMEGVQTIKVIF